MSNDPKQERSVAVVIAARDAAATITRAVVSALHEPDVAQVIVVDDASIDGTAAIARSCDDATGRLSIIELGTNLGPAGARNRGFAACTATWIGVLDADDFFLPGRVTRLLADASDADFVADDLLQVQEGEEASAPTALIGASLSGARLLDLTDFVLANVSRRGRLRKELGFLKPLMRRSYLNAHGLRYREELRLGEDYELYARALALGARFLLVPPRGYVAVTRPGSLSDRHSELDLFRLRECDRDLASLPGLTYREQQALRRHSRSIDCKLEWRYLIEAMKARDVVRSAKPFMKSWTITGHLLMNLGEALWARVGLGLVSPGG